MGTLKVLAEQAAKLAAEKKTKAEAEKPKETEKKSFDSVKNSFKSKDE